MANITEYTITMKEGSDTYTLRPMILSDKTFFKECMADFPYEDSSVVNSDFTFQKYINQWVEDHEDLEYPISKGTEAIVSQIGYKNDTPIFMAHSIYDYCTEENLFERDLVIAIHPDQRNKGLYKYYVDICQYYSYKLEGVDYITYETYDSVEKIKKYQKDKGWIYLRTDPAGAQGIKHIFKNTKEQYSQNSKYTFEVSKASYSKTDARYATDHIKATYIKWDDGLS